MKTIHGVVVPILTPFTGSGGIDHAALRRLVTFILEAGAPGVFPLGTTGESASVSLRARREVIETVGEVIAGKGTMYAGIAGNCLEESLELADHAAACGASFVVAHPPSYYPLDDAELEAYFIRLADHSPCSLMLYNIPKTTHISISLMTVRALSRHPRILGLKDSENDAQRFDALLQPGFLPDDFAILVGCAGQSSRTLRLGAHGLVPSSANLVPELYQRMWAAAQEKDWETVDALQLETDQVSAQYQAGHSLGQSLSRLKQLAAERGLCGPRVLPPLPTL
jgi:4-hydroxy-tetrahydrodipicolinate synthase